jgi:hydrogenase maturation protein HypF
VKHLRLTIKGIIQGVGFRPFVYSIAIKNNLKGYVLNNTKGVLIEIQGKEKDIKKFLEELVNSPPPLSQIEEIKKEYLPISNFKSFTIKKSKEEKEKFTLISPDVCICKDCLKELFDRKNFRYLYPFINCTNCGPRFTIIKDIPYDRKNTTMAVFKMCEKCKREYEDPQNRRFHAEPVACPECGPEVKILNFKEKDDAIRKTVQLLKNGKIVAIKGLGGYHLACDALNDSAVRKLRNRKYREDKPFAIMCPDLKTIKEYCILSKEEKELLLSFKRPIVLLKKKKNCPISKYVAPNNPYLGIMLPYTPLHYLLFYKSNLKALVMTSGNISDEPIAYKDFEAKERLKKIADYFLIHNREIYIRCDDSVSRIFNKKEVLIRRSRGYVPYPIKLNFPLKEILATGAEKKNTFCLTYKYYAFLSHHIGDLENFETLKSFEEGIEHFKKLFYINPKIIAYDMHPEYLSTKYAKEIKNCKLIPVQHHHAHIVSAMAENNLKNENVIGVAFDGTGYGTDGNLWGGEFLICNFKDFKRFAHFEYIPLIGGEKSIKEPYRMAFSYLYKIYGENYKNLKIDWVKRINPKNLEMFKILFLKRINSPLTSSCGRLFDAVSSLLGVRDYINYEGQAAIELELLSYKSLKKNYKKYSYEFVKEKEGIVIKFRNFLEEIISDLEKNIPREDIGLNFHYSIASLIEELCSLIRNQAKINKVVLSGGVFQNIILLNFVFKLLRKKNFEIYINQKVPTNDGGISLGQAVIANFKEDL